MYADVTDAHRSAPSLEDTTMWLPKRIAPFAALLARSPAVFEKASCTVDRADRMNRAIRRPR